MLTPQFVLNLATALAIVPFAASGGSQTSIEQALDDHVDIAVSP